MKLKINTPAPNFTLQTVEGELVTLSAILKDKNVLLVFLRHLG
ncbi:MAG: redoxin domain-containing protein [Chloroflexi bacterium]|nr:redoxin domain-containing protein [Chloroflexota bacterium]